ncbi:hypothetical protein AMATHDRAFT_6301 [Amanita thiersii Skay4041]|uniref:Polyketide synthase n=1 Tax=Amanita thiersii Skay4041 TaxID=703135 RepID=A0A2A9NBB8_9AGAR|nr:hypothetical protein AMATHDRAFT_6301 [Amanita thiersii Skay4041]
MPSSNDNSQLLYIPIFPGQGSAVANSRETRQLAMLDAELPACSVLLSACHQAFIAELSTVPPFEFSHLDLVLSDFAEKQALLKLPDQRYASHPVVTSPTLFLVQILRYLAFIEEIGVSTGSLTPFSDILRCNTKYAVGILGFSSGILAACVVGSSVSLASYIAHAVEGFRLSIWIGIRTQLYRNRVLADRFPKTAPSLPWSLVFFGLSLQTAEAALTKFNKESNSPSLYITAVMDASTVTISGHPDVLKAFSVTFGPAVTIHQTTVDTLYHIPIHRDGIYQQILQDVTRRRITFPNVADLHAPIRSTLTGDLITKDSGVVLTELAVDLLLTHPVNWDLVTKQVIEAFPEAIQVQLVNVGPGAGLARNFQRALPHSSILDLSGISRKTRSANLKKHKQEPVAIVGMAIHMPGALNISQLWQILEHGINTVTEIPEHRFKVSDFNTATGGNAKRSMRAHTGNFIDGADEFDNRFFNISPREAKCMDPQQRLLLHTAYEALEDSGYVPNSTPTSNPERFGCYIGASTHDYALNLKNDIDVYYSTGTLKAFLSGRISYAMGLSGPSMVVDTACSSSIVALYQAARALMNRDCDAALVGGVNIISSPDMFLGLDRGHFLSPTGQCKPFDLSADGYSRAEGCGVFVLKRLVDAVAENDRIWGVIKGVEVNQSGLAHSITHPHSGTQTNLFKQLLESSGIEPQRVNVVEAHGTGTPAGDPCEMESIRSVLGQQRGADNPLHITSLKANIGHLEAASGAAGLVKLLLMLQHKRIPRQISFQNLNPDILPLEIDNTVIDTTNTVWNHSHQGLTRLAMLNNFGASGSNAALLVEEFQNTRAAPTVLGMSFVFGLSTKDPDALEALRQKFLDWLCSDESSECELPDIAYTSTARRQLYESRLAVSASSKEELIKKLRSARGTTAKERDATVVFVFSGQGSQYLGMGSFLYATSPTFKRHIDECHAILSSAGFPGVHSIITPGTGRPNLTDIQRIEAFQAAIFTIEYALAKLWISWGVYPKAVVGHSLGEYAALAIAEVLSLHSALMLVAHRARMMVQMCSLGSTGMLSVNLSSEDVRMAMTSSGQFSELSIACHNSPQDCVVAGPIKQIKALKRYLDSKMRCRSALLSVPFGYHSAAMKPILDDLTSIANNLPIHSPRIPIVSNLHGELVLPRNVSAFNEAYFSRHCAEPVQFEKGITALLSEPEFTTADAWIEIGPHPTVIPMLRSNPLFSSETLLLPSIHKQQNVWSTLTSSLTCLYTSNIHVLWREVYSHLGTVSCISLPSYPFKKSRFWVPYRELADAPRPAIPVTSSHYSILYSLPHISRCESGIVSTFQTPSSHLAPYIAGHRVGKVALCPASVFIEQVFSGILLTGQALGIVLMKENIEIQEMEFSRPLAYHDNVERMVITTITICEREGSFDISSRPEHNSDVVHVRGQFHMSPGQEIQAKLSHVSPTVDGRIKELLSQKMEAFSMRTIYEVIFPRVVEYSKEYHSIRSLVVSSDGMEGSAHIKLPSHRPRGTFVVHPVFMDTLLHVAGFMANLQAKKGDAYICCGVELVEAAARAIDEEATFTVYCRSAWSAEKNSITSEVYAFTATEPKVIVAQLRGAQFRRTCLNKFSKNLRVDQGRARSLSSSLKRLRSGCCLITNSKVTTADLRPLAIGELAFEDITPTVVSVVSEACGIEESEISINTDLAYLGVDSLMSIEINTALERTFQLGKPNTLTLSRCRTIKQLVDELQSRICLSQISSDVSPSSSIVSSPRTLVSDDQLLGFNSPTKERRLDIKEIIASVLDISVHDIHNDQDLQSLGLDSLTSIEAVQALRNTFRCHIPNNLFYTCRTLQEVHSCLSNCSRASCKSDFSIAEHGISLVERTTFRLDENPVPLQAPMMSSGRYPLFLIHDGSGLISYYHRLGSLERAVWGINNPHFETGESWHDITQMARYYADIIRRTEAGPVIIGGWSFGGVLAYEISQQLKGSEIKVKGILLIDSPDPITHVPLSEALINSVLGIGTHITNVETSRLIKRQFTSNTKLLSEYKLASGDLCVQIIYLRSKEGYNPSDISDIPKWLSDRSSPEAIVAIWSRLSRSPVRVIEIPGNHFNPFHPSNVDDVSRCIVEGLGYLDEL